MTLREFFKEYPKAAIAFSGGTDSSYLLYAAKQYGCDIQPYFVKTAFQPQFELNDAIKITTELGIPLKIMELDIFQNEKVTQNPKNRCYYCKTVIMSAIKNTAKQDGYDVLIDGTNASDDESDRPGSVAIKEQGVLSPLRLCGVTKTKIIKLSEEAGLFTAKKPANACLATRIPAGTKIEKEMLFKVEKAEDYLRSLGFYDLRVRIIEGCAKIQILDNQFEMAFSKRKLIANELSKYFRDIFLDLHPRR